MSHDQTTGSAGCDHQIKPMKKLMTALCFTCALAVATQAEEGQTKKKSEGKSAAAAEQKALRKEILAKYDTNKNGRLNKEEKARISAEDKAKFNKAFPEPKKKTAKKSEAADKESETK